MGTSKSSSAGVSIWVISPSVGPFGFTIETVRELMRGSACVAGGLPRLLIAVPNYLCFDLGVLGGFEAFFSRFTTCQKFGSAAAISSEALL
jgi:hypothetical protein